MGSKPHRILFYWHTVGNKFLTRLSNMFTNLNLTDMETCYKLFNSTLVKKLNLKQGLLCNRYSDIHLPQKKSKTKDAVSLGHVPWSYWS